MGYRTQRTAALILTMGLSLWVHACGGASTAELDAIARTGVAQTAAAFSPTPPPTSTATSTPTKNPTSPPDRAATRNARATQTADENPCIRWDQVNESHFSQPDLCVYGRIVKLQESERYAQMVRFSHEAGTFMLWSEWYTYLGLKPGMCVAAVGFLGRDVGLIGMEIAITELYEYDGCD